MMDSLLTVIADVQQRILRAGGDLNAVLNLVAEQALRMAGADAAVVELREDDEMVYRAVAGTASPFLGLRLSVHESLSGTVALSGEPVVCADCAKDPRVDQAAARSVGARSMVLMPLRYGSETVGVLKVYAAVPGRFTTAHLETLELLGGLMSTSITVARDSEERERLHARLLALFDAAPEAIYATDSEGRVTLWTPSAERLLGWRADEIQGLLLTVFPERCRAEAEQKLESLRAGQRLRGWETTHLTRDGQEIPVRVFAALKRDTGAAPRGIAFFAADIREEIVLRERLKQSQKLETIGRLAGGIAHDFNNMLTAIAGFSRLLIDDPELSQDQKENVEEILAAATRSAYITQQLLAYSRRQVLSPRPLDLNSILGGVRGLAGQLLGKNVEVEMMLDPDLWQVCADRGQMEQVILNLLTNARDAFGTEPGRVAIRTENTTVDAARAFTLGLDHPGAYVRLSLRDNGPGIPPDVLEHIFEPFFTTKHMTEGTGLGLATVEGVARQTGGAVTVESELGVGTTFTIYLPVADGLLPEADAAPAAAQVGQKPARILVVDDEAPIRKLMRKVLERAGHNVVDAAEPLAALEILRRDATRFDLVVSDVVMPQLNGFELWEQSRILAGPLPFLFVSGYVDEELGNAPALGGEDAAFLTKPFSPAQLVGAVAALLRGEPERATPP